MTVTNLTRAQMTFTQSGDDLLLTRNGTPSDSIRVAGWFAGAGNQLDYVQFSDQTMTAAQVSALFGSGLMSAQTSSRWAAQEDRFGGAVLQLIDAMNHFGAKHHERLIGSGGIKEHLGYMDGVVAVDAHVARREMEHDRLLAQELHTQSA